MKILKFLCFSIVFSFVLQISYAQKIQFTEYNLPNGLHVILHQDKSAPVVAVTVMYHVGSKNELSNRTGFAHFFEHLLFEGSENIKRGDFDKIVSSKGGQSNATTNQDRTFYYEVFPSNHLKTGLWLESERMLHPVINEVGVETQNEVVKEEKRLRYDNRPYGILFATIFDKIFTKHPYHWTPIGSMDDLDSAKLSEFKDFFKTYYSPSNAVLTLAGDFEIEDTKSWIDAYFSEVPKGKEISYEKISEEPISQTMIDTVYDANIQIPAIATAYRAPDLNSKDATALDMVSKFLAGGASAKLTRKLVDEKKNALQISSFNYTLEDYGLYINFALPNNNTPLDTLLKDMDEEIVKLQNSLISDTDFTKLQNQFENDYVDVNSKMLGVAENLSNAYTYHKNTNEINSELDKIRSVSKQDIMNVAKKYLQPSSRLILYYLPKKNNG